MTNSSRRFHFEICKFRFDILICSPFYYIIQYNRSTKGGQKMNISYNRQTDFKKIQRKRYRRDIQYFQRRRGKHISALVSAEVA